MKRILILLLVAAMMCIGITAAAEGDTLAFDTGVNTVNEGETLQTVLTREGDPAGGELSYTSSDPRIATVDENGVVTGVKKGVITITALVKTETKTWRATLKLTVVRPVTSVEVNTTKLPVYTAEDPLVAGLLTAREDAAENALPVILLPVKKQYQLAITVEPKDATDRRIEMTSSDPEIFKAAGNIVTGVAPGEGILTVASVLTPDVTARFRILVIQPVTKLTVEASAPSVTVGGQISVASAAMPENASIPAVTWSSGDERILTVDENGVVTGVKRGNGRVIATATDGSNIRANFTVRVVQLPEALTLSAEEMTIDVGRTAAVKATIAPNDADNKKVVWTSSDEGVATVSRDGHIKAVALGDCTVTCTSQETESVSASVAVHVQQPVQKIVFNDKSMIVCVGEAAPLSLTIEPANASNQALAFTSSNDKVAAVDENGVVTGIAGGKVTITAMTTDGTKRTAKITVQVGEHVRGVSMVREHAYIDKGETATAGATLEPKDALNDRMTWVSSDESVVTANGDTNKKMKLKGINYGEAVVTGTTEDGGYETSIVVTVGDFDKGLKFRDFGFDQNGNFWLTIRNDTDLVITSITAEVAIYDATGEVIDPVAINTKNGSHKVDVVWNGTLKPGQQTGKDRWKMVNYKAPANMDITRGTVTLYSYQVNHDWIKIIRERNRQWKEY